MHTSWFEYMIKYAGRPIYEMDYEDRGLGYGDVSFTDLQAEDDPRSFDVSVDFRQNSGASFIPSENAIELNMDNLELTSLMHEFGHARQQKMNSNLGSKLRAYNPYSIWSKVGKEGYSDEEFVNNYYLRVIAEYNAWQQVSSIDPIAFLKNIENIRRAFYSYVSPKPSLRAALDLHRPQISNKISQINAKYRKAFEKRLVPRTIAMAAKIIGVDEDSVPEAIQSYESPLIERMKAIRENLIDDFVIRILRQARGGVPFVNESRIAPAFVDALKNDAGVSDPDAIEMLVERMLRLLQDDNVRQFMLQQA